MGVDFAATLAKPAFDWQQPSVLLIGGARRKIKYLVDLDADHVLAVWQSQARWNSETFVKTTGLNALGEGYGRLTNLDLDTYFLSHNRLKSDIAILTLGKAVESYQLTTDQAQQARKQREQGLQAIDTLREDLNRRLEDFCKKLEQENF